MTSTRHNDSTSSDTAIPRRAAGAPAPMSYAQELLWLLDRAMPGLTAYNVPRAIRIRGPLDAGALRAAIEDVVARHEVLRTTYATDAGHGIQVVHPHRTFELPMIDVGAVDTGSRAAEIERVVLEEARRPFDLASDLLLRARLVRASDQEHTLVLVSHHIASDGWSRGVLFRELSEAYEARVAGGAPELSPLPIQYADFATWQRELLQGHAHDEHLAYWRARLAPPLPTLDLPTDFPRPATQGFDGARCVTVLPSRLVERLRQVGMDHGATLYMALLAAYHTVLHRYSGQDDILTGSPIAGRTRTETEGLIGYFANILAMRTSFVGDPTFGQILERVAEHAIDAYEHEDVPFEKLVLELRAGGETPAHAPLFRCVLTMEDTIADELRLGTAEVVPYSLDFGQAKFDLTLLVAEVPDGLRLGLWYRTDLFSEGYATRFLGHLRAVLEAGTSEPATRVRDIALLTDEERRELARWNATHADEGEAANLVALFEQQAVRVPSRAAVVAPRASATAAGSVAGTVVLTYAELNARANQLAHHLRTLAIVANSPVGLLLDRSADAMVGLWGILKAGGAYVPLSVDAPTARIARQLAESGASVVVTGGAQANGLPAGVTVVALDRDAAVLGAYSDANPAAIATPNDLAYVMYTSGSTGVPKGVAVTHANVVHYVRAVSRVLSSVPADRSGDGLAALDGLKFGMASTLAADLGNTSLFPALLSGATLHVLGRDVTTEPTRFAEYVAVHPLDVLKITPNHLAALTAGKSGPELAALLPARWLVTGGEALRPELARTLAAARCRVLNHYGPTETTVGALTYEVTPSSLDAALAQGAQTLPIGRPLANTLAVVVDAHGVEQPIGVPGELWLGGAGVAQGYLNRPELTAERFTTFEGTRVYRTGDRVRRLPDGTLEFLGRADDQVKVRGYRVELAEIEQSLLAHPSVVQCVVSLRAAESSEPMLVAYAVPKSGGYAASHAERPTPERLREWLVEQLPEYMVPATVMVVDALPLTANGKIDRAALPDPSQLDAPDRHVAPRTPTEAKVARIWCDVLKKERVGATDNFLDLGGHSLLAIRVLGRISKEFGVRLALRALFESPTVTEVAALVDAELRQRADEQAVAQALAGVEGLSDADVQRMLADSARDGS